MVRQLYIFLCYYQLDFVPLLWLKDKKYIYNIQLSGILTDRDKIVEVLVGRLTISNHWCTATATCVPSGLVNTNTSPGTALSGLKKKQTWSYYFYCLSAILYVLKEAVSIHKTYCRSGKIAPVTGRRASKMLLWFTTTHNCLAQLGTLSK